MKVITEAKLRSEIKTTRPETYYIPEDTILSPAAKEYLNQWKIPVKYEKDKEQSVKREESQEKKPVAEVGQTKPTLPKYKDYETGASYFQKPEHMTQLFGNLLVDKNHPRIKFRGKMDRLQAEVVYAQAEIAGKYKHEKLMEDLGDVLNALREIMRCEVMDEPFERETIIGLSHEELRKQSHNPMKYYKIKQLLLADYTMGIVYAQLNLIRASIRECEVLAADAFRINRKFERLDIIQELNRLSSALHIMMCRYLAGEYPER